MMTRMIQTMWIHGFCLRVTLPFERLLLSVANSSGPKTTIRLPFTIQFCFHP